ncbi:MAG: hypothetical protein ACYCWB_04505 [Thiobacillus sp.]
MELTRCIFLLPLFFATTSNAGGLEQFSPTTSYSQEQIYRDAISACRAIIKQKTGGSKISITNPCPSNNWKGITATANGLSIVLHAQKSINNSGLIEDAIRRNTVLVTCQTDSSGRVTGFKDTTYGITNMMAGSGLCHFDPDRGH